MNNLAAAVGVPKSLLLMFKLNKSVCANFWSPTAILFTNVHPPSFVI